MLYKHLIAKTCPKALDCNMVYWKNYRITVLSDQLIRLERSEEKKFRDEATLSVWFRNMEKQNFKAVDKGDNLEISTRKIKISVKENRSDCTITLNDKTQNIDNSENLLGTYSTIDRCNGDNLYSNIGKKNQEIVKIKLNNGVCSKNGVAVIDDSNSLTLGKNGEVKAETANGSDEYIFAYGDNYEEAVKELYNICGKTPLVPKFALGTWWSRYYVYTDREYLKLLNYFEDEEIPLTVATIDMDWHYSNNIEKELNIPEEYKITDPDADILGWTGYSWNKNLFPDHVKFLKEVHEKNLKITLNIHPAYGIRFWEDCYNSMANAMNIDPKTKETIAFDITNNKFINNYFSKVHNPLEKEGVDFWWIDWQQGNTSKMKGLDPLWALNHYHYLDSKKHNKNPLILSRYCGVGAHRYPLGFSGDSFMTWDTLDFLPYFTATASNIGYGWWSHDIGGHMLGEKNDELYLRHIQFGVFSPVNRLHSTSNITCTKEPWAYSTGEIAKKFIRFRHRMIPYLFTASYINCKEGIPLIEPLYWKFKGKECYNFKNEYTFGSQLLVIPITTPSVQNGISIVKGFIPSGRWTDIFTGAIYDGGKNGKVTTLRRNFNSIPVLIKEGGILPLSNDKGNSIKNPKVMEIDVYLGNGSFTLYENGDEINKKGEFFTTFENFNTTNGKENIQTLKISLKGENKVIPKVRTFKVRFKDIENGKISLKVNGKEKEVKDIITNCTATDIEIENGNSYEISVTYKKKTRLEEIIDYAKYTLTIAPYLTNDKKYLFEQLKNAESLKEFCDIIDKNKNIDDFIKEWLKETI